MASDISGAQFRALELVKKIGERLLREHPEIADLCRSPDNPQRYIDIAENYLGSEANLYPQVATRAVAYAVRRLIPSQERQNITKRKRTRQLKALFGGFQSELFRQHCRRASKLRHELCGVDVAAMTRGRGLVPWLEAEKVEVIKQDVQGERTDDIAQVINRQFHNGQKVRSAKNVYDMLRYEKRKKKG